MPLWEEYEVLSANDALKWVGREQTKLAYFLEVQAGLERLVVFHHGGGEFDQVLPLSFDWGPVRRYLEPDIQLVFVSQDRASHPVYAIVPFQRAVVELDVHATVGVQQADESELLARYLKEIESLMPSVPTDRRGEAFKHLRSLTRIIRPAQ
jgi:hypothetical protein